MNTVNNLIKGIKNKYHVESERFDFGFITVFAILSVIIIFPLILMAFTSLRTGTIGQPAQWTIDVYTNVLFADWFLPIVLNTAILAIGSTALGLFIGTFLAWITTRTNTPYVDKLQVPIILPFFIAPFIGAIAWGLLGDSRIGMLNNGLELLFGVSPINIYSLPGMIFVMGLYYSPFVYLLVYGAMTNVDSSLEEASTVCGAGTLETARRITFPLIAPSILSAAVLIFVASAGQFGIPAVLGMTEGIYVMSTQIFTETSSVPVDFNTAAVLGSLLAATISVLVILRNKYLKGREYETIGGDQRRDVVELGKWRWVTFGFVISYILFAVVLPLGTIIIASFVPYWTGFPQLSELTLEHWRWILYEYPITYNAVTNSLILATLGALIAMTLAGIVSWYSIRTKVTGSNFLDTVGTIPIAVPGLVMGLAYIFLGLRFFTFIYGTIILMGMAYISRFIPYGLRSVGGALRQLNTDLEEASRIAGAGPLRSYKDITLPLIKPSFVSGYVILFVIFVRELSVSILIYGPGSEVFSVAIFDLWADGNLPELAVLTVIKLAFVVIAIIVLSQVGPGGLLKSLEDTN